MPWVLYNVEHNKKFQNTFSVIPTKYLAMSMDFFVLGERTTPILPSDAVI